MGSRLELLKFPTLLNPFGIVFNPVSIAVNLERLLEGEPFRESELFQSQGIWHSFEHHGRFSNPDKVVALEDINQSFSAARHFLQTSNRLVITLGTAHVFLLKESGRIVANCHKVPAKAFERRRLRVKEVVDNLTAVFQKLKAALPTLEIIVTVSPVRHLRDGLMENQRSKATLLLALEEVGSRLPFVHYFPAYEILLDDLRDYRFYAEDMAHPSQQATDYIWEYFETAFFGEETKRLCEQLAEVQAALAHRPFHPKTLDHQLFLRNQLARVEQLAKQFPQLNFEAEKAQINHSILP